MRCRSSRSRLLAVATVATACGLAPPSASAHTSFLSSQPAPGTRLQASPGALTLTFTEGLNPKLSTGTLVTVPGGRALASASGVSDTKLIVRPDRRLPKGAYRVVWHSVAADDGHGLDGFISFGVQAAAGGGHSSVTQSPFARDGWLRVLARALMYAALLLFAGALTLRLSLGRRGRSWLVPAGYAHRPEMDAVQAACRERTLIRDLGFLAAGAAAVSAGADAVDAAGGFSLGRMHSYLLSSQAGTARFMVVVLALLAALVAARRPRFAALPALGALAALAASGHTASASSPTLAILVDWIHLLSGAVWLGGIALIVVTWGPSLRTGSRARRRAVARDVLPVFGRIALPAFVVVVASGGVSALIELGTVAALWQTGYGRVLVVKMVLVGLVAGASYVHVFRLRPGLLSGSGAPGEERRHWRLVRTEPVLGLGIVAAVALLAPPARAGRNQPGTRRRAAVQPVCACVPTPRRARGRRAGRVGRGRRLAAARPSRGVGDGAHLCNRRLARKGQLHRRWRARARVRARMQALLFGRASPGAEGRRAPAWP